MTDVVVGLCARNMRWLVARRAEHVHLPGVWEFPGGKMLPDESPEDAVTRELHEELGIEVRPVRTLDPVRFQYPDRAVVLHPILCDLIAGDPEPCDAAVVEVAWVRCEDLPVLEMPEANRGILDQLAEL